jgi:MoxR-like ATPase
LKNDQTGKQDVELVDQLSGKIKEVKTEIAKVIVGQEEIIDQLLISLLARGHCFTVHSRFNAERYYRN